MPKKKPHTIVIQHPAYYGGRSDGDYLCRIHIRGLFKRNMTIMEREIRKIPFIVEDLSTIVHFDFSVIKTYAFPQLSGKLDVKDNVTPCTYNSAFVGNTAGVVDQLKRMCNQVREQVRKFEKANPDKRVPDSVSILEHRTNLERSFQRQPHLDGEHLNRLQILNHPNFEGPWPLDREERCHPWQTVRHWVKALKPEQLQGFFQRCEMMLRQGGKITCSSEIDEINFLWANMYGGLILRDDEFSSHT